MQMCTICAKISCDKCLFLLNVFRQCRRIQKDSYRFWVHNAQSFVSSLSSFKLCMVRLQFIPIDSCPMRFNCEISTLLVHFKNKRKVYDQSMFDEKVRKKIYFDETTQTSEAYSCHVMMVRIVNAKQKINVVFDISNQIISAQFLFFCFCFGFGLLRRLNGVPFSLHIRWGLAVRQMLVCHRVHKARIRLQLCNINKSLWAIATRKKTHKQAHRARVRRKTPCHVERCKRDTDTNEAFKANTHNS